MTAKVVVPYAVLIQYSTGCYARVCRAVGTHSSVPNGVLPAEVRGWAGPRVSEGRWDGLLKRITSKVVMTSDLENLVLAKLAAHSKPFAGGKGGLDAEEIGRAVGPVGSRILVDALLSLQRKKLLLSVYTDEPQHRELYYLAKTTPNISET